MEMVKCEMWLQVDEDGDWSVGPELGDLDVPVGASRLVKVTVNVPTPKTVELEATVAAEPSVAELKVAG